MNKTKEIFIIGFALFSLFFGAGNLILPPFLGFQAGNDWLIVFVGFVIAAVLIPILGIIAHAKLQGTLFDFGKKVSPLFSLTYCFIVYVISISLPAPRTAAVTHEMAIAPYFDVSPLVTSSIYFLLVFLFVINRSKMLNIIGKFLTPLIVIILLSIIVVGLFIAPNIINSSNFEIPIIAGLLEGYQTFDAIGGVVVGGVIVVSLNLKRNISKTLKKELILKGGIVAGMGLFIIYLGLIYSGAIFSSEFSSDASRSEVLNLLTSMTLGSVGTIFLSVLVALACFTTAVGIIIGTADYFKGRFNNSKLAYIITAIIGCILGVAVGQFDVHYILNIALPVLMFIYPITIVLILLNIILEKFASPIVFKSTVLVTIIFSIPDFLQFFISIENLQIVHDLIPFSSASLGWVFPALVTFIVVNIYRRIFNSSIV